MIFSLEGLQVQNLQAKPAIIAKFAGPGKWPQPVDGQSMHQQPVTSLSPGPGIWFMIPIPAHTTPVDKLLINQGFRSFPNLNIHKNNAS